MSEFLNNRQVSLKQVGGTKGLHGLPRKQRALVLASLMEEAPRKGRSAEACILTAFKFAIEEGNVLSARKLFEKLSPPDSSKSAEKHVSEKISYLRNTEKDGLLADKLATAFRLDGEAMSRFREYTGRMLKTANQKLDSDYTFSAQLFKRILTEEADVGVSMNSVPAAIGLTIHYLRNRELRAAIDVIESNLFEDGSIASFAKMDLIPEVQKMMQRTSREALSEFSDFVEKKGMLPFFQESVLGLTKNLAKKDPGELKTIFDLMVLFKLENYTEDIGTHLMSIHYLEIAEIASDLGNKSGLDLALNNYFGLLEESARHNPKIYEKLYFVARRFSYDERFPQFGVNAVLYCIANGELEKAKELAGKSRALLFLHARIVSLLDRVKI